MQSPKGEILKVISRCGDCGEEYESQGLMGIRTDKYCPACREKQRRLFEVQEKETRANSLAFHRQEWVSGLRGIPRRYRGITWDDFEYDQGGEGNKAKVAKLREYAEVFPMEKAPHGVESLLIARDMNGVGKTMLVCLLLNDLINRFDQVGRERCPYQFWSVDEVKLRIRSAERYGSAETVEDVYSDFAAMWLLILDDVGKERLEGEAGFTYEMYGNILNRRYNNELPVILTSNLAYTPWVEDGLSLTDLMGRAGVSRLMEMTGGQVYVIEGPDRR